MLGYINCMCVLVFWDFNLVYLQNYDFGVYICECDVFCVWKYKCSDCGELVLWQMELKFLDSCEVCNISGRLVCVYFIFFVICDDC